MINKLLERLFSCWFFLGMTLSFICFGFGGLILGDIVIPLLPYFVCPKMSKKHQAQYAIHCMFHFMIFMLQILGFMRFKFIDFAQVQADKGCLIIANHPTLLDYVAIISRLPTCDNIVKEALWHNVFVKRVIARAGYIPNLQSSETFTAIKQTLQAGNNLLMFPEGTRTDFTQPFLLKRGAAQIALRAQVPIRLIHVECEPLVLGKNFKWLQLPKKIVRYKFTVGEKIDPNVFLEKYKLPSIAARQLTRYLQSQLSRGE